MEPIARQYVAMMISEATVDDVDELVGLEKQCYVDGWGSEAMELAVVSAETTVGIACLADQDGKRCGPIEGYIVCRHTPGVSSVLCMGVLMDSRGCGIGTRLLEEVPGLGTRDVYAEVIGEPAFELFRKVGFKVLGNMGQSGVVLMKMPKVTNEAR